MKFHVGDVVVVTSGRDKGMQSKVLRVLPKDGKVVVQGVSLYTRHRKPIGGKAGERIRTERAIDPAKIAIWNPDTKQPDRIGYSVTSDGGETKKVRIYRKTGKAL